MTVTILAGLALILIRTDPVHPDGKIDWFGAFLGLGGLILFSFVWK